MNESPIIHIIAQSYWHDCAAIVANETALKALREAVDSALENGTGGACVSAADGEGYCIAIIRRQDMNDAPLGYTDECARDIRDCPEWFLNAVVEAVKRIGEQNEKDN